MTPELPRNPPESKWKAIGMRHLPQLFCLSVCVACFAQQDIVGGEPHFTNITNLAGTGGPTSPHTGGHGVLFADVNADRLPDLYITMIFRQPMADLFFHNIDGRLFIEDGKRRGIADFDGGSHGACFADLDNDGDFDLFNGTTWDYPRHPAHNNLFRNDGIGHFTELSSQAGIPRERRWPTRGVLTFDMDQDGNLDLFCVTNYLGSEDPPAERNEIYRNNSNWNFSSITDGPLSTAPCGQGAIDTDFDGDGDIDIIAANRTGQVNILKNDGLGNMVLLDASAIGIRHRAGDGISMADIDNDGDLDALFASDDQGHLYVNQGAGIFSFQRTFKETNGYMGGFADLDNDSDLDLVFAGDEVCWLNAGNGRFQPGPAIPVGKIDDPRGIAFADIDNDGDMDFAIACKRSQNALIRNNCGTGNWLKVELISPQGQIGAFGAVTRVYRAGKIGEQLIGYRESRSNNGYLGQDDPVLHFGLGTLATVDVVTTFLDGTTIQRRGVVANQFITVDASPIK